MSVESAIHSRWSDSSGLTDLLPAERFTTGSRLDDGAVLPSAILELEDTQKRYVNTSHLKTCDIRIKFWVRDHDDGIAIREQIELAYDNTHWTSGNTKVIASRIETDTALQEDDDVWQFVFQLDLITKKIG